MERFGIGASGTIIASGSIHGQGLISTSWLMRVKELFFCFYYFLVKLSLFHWDYVVVFLTLQGYLDESMFSSMSFWLASRLQ